MPSPSSYFYYQPGGGAPFYGTGVGGFDPKILLLLGGGLALVMLLGRR